MYEGEPLETVLRLLCLYCAVHGGVPKKYFEGLRRDLLNTYGHQHLLTLAALQRAGAGQGRERAESGQGAGRERSVGLQGPQWQSMLLVLGGRSTGSIP